MKTIYRNYLFVIIGVMLVASFFLPPLAKAKQQKTQVQSGKNHVAISVAVNTNGSSLSDLER